MVQLLLQLRELNNDGSGSSEKKREKVLFDSYKRNKSYPEKIAHLKEMIQIMEEIQKIQKK